MEVNLAFQNCLLASFPPTRFRIFAPPGCSSTKLSILYTLPSIIMYSPLSTVLCSATCLVVNWSDMAGYSRDLVSGAPEAGSRGGDREIEVFGG